MACRVIKTKEYNAIECKKGKDERLGFDLTHPKTGEVLRIQMTEEEFKNKSACAHISVRGEDDSIKAFIKSYLAPVPEKKKKKKKVKK